MLRKNVFPIEEEYMRESENCVEGAFRKKSELYCNH